MADTATLVEELSKLTVIEAADLVTEMTEIKHPFTAGIRAQQGIEF